MADCAFQHIATTNYQPCSQAADSRGGAASPRSNPTAAPPPECAPHTAARTAARSSMRAWQRQKRIRILFGIRIRIHGDTGISLVFVLYSYSNVVSCKIKYLYTICIR